MTGDIISVLFVDGSAEDTARAVDALEAAGLAVTFRRVDAYSAFVQALKEQAWDVVLCDHRVPRVDPLVAWSAIQQRRPGTPFVVFSDLVHGEALVELLDAGVQYFIEKHRLDTLAPKIRALLGSRRGAAAEPKLR